MYNLRNQQIDFDFRPQYIKEDVHNGKLKRSQTEIGDLIMNIVGPPLGKLAIIPDSLPQSNFNQAAVLIRPLLHKKIIVKYLFYYLSQMSEINSISTKGSAGQVNISLTQSQNMRIALPPLQEQQRIVNEIEHLWKCLGHVDEEARNLNNAVERIKTKLLELAIMGKLVAQDPADEPAVDLLKRLNPNAVVSADTSHYNGQNLPNGWIQCKFSDLFNVRSARRVHKADWRSEGIPFYRAREIGKLSDLGTVDNDLYIDNLLYNEFAKSGVPQSGDIMITAVGTLGKTYIVRKGDKFYYKDGSVLCIENRNGIDPRYIEMFISSSHFKEQYIWESQGTTVATLTMDRINSYSFVLPPLNEQKRIVSKVDELFAVIDQIKQSLE